MCNFAKWLIKKVLISFRCLIYGFKLNSYEYWNLRFKNDWETKGGNLQTKLFMKMLVDNIPNDISTEIYNHKYSICDVGCALGDGCELLKKKFVASLVTGIDFSENAISKAKKMFGCECNFKTGDIAKMQEEFDIVILSNILEHFKEPIKVVEKCIKNAKKYIIILVPYDENSICPEHVSFFKEDSFPIGIKSFFKTHEKIIEEKDVWRGKQYLVIYQNL